MITVTIARSEVAVHLTKCRRPYGGAVLALSTVGLGKPEQEFTLPVFSPSDEKTFATLHEAILKSSGVEAIPKAKVSCYLSLLSPRVSQHCIADTHTHTQSHAHATHRSRSEFSQLTACAGHRVQRDDVPGRDAGQVQGRSGDAPARLPRAAPARRHPQRLLGHHGDGRDHAGTRAAMHVHCIVPVWWYVRWRCALFIAVSLRAVQ